MRSTIALFLTLLLTLESNAIPIEFGGSPSDGNAFLTFQENVTFQIQTASTNGIIFVMQDVLPGDRSFDLANFAGLNFTSNQSQNIDLDRWVANPHSIIGADIKPDDQYFFALETADQNFYSGDTIILNSGTGTLSSSYPSFDLPSSGDYNMFIANGHGIKIGEVIPEPSTISLFGIAYIAMIIYRKKSRTRGWTLR
ncbi:PEP-CTERM sorting domain-containing protein [Verrucomicrobia bacterium S94]|nr:PEP-CTERM sorting domain-containing protein [Verrucomicrobia bacterium S94]